MSHSPEYPRSKLTESRFRGIGDRLPDGTSPRNRLTRARFTSLKAANPGQEIYYQSMDTDSPLPPGSGCLGLVIDAIALGGVFTLFGAVVLKTTR